MIIARSPRANISCKARVNDASRRTFILGKSAPRRSLLRRIQTAIATRRERQALLGPDPALPCDIGLTRAQALAEASRPIWDAPATWRR